MTDRRKAEDMSDETEAIWAREGWKPGDPCAACGSRATSYDHDTGAHCGSCGRSDSDE